MLENQIYESSSSTQEHAEVSTKEAVVGGTLLKDTSKGLKTVQAEPGKRHKVKASEMLVPDDGFGATETTEVEGDWGKNSDKSKTKSEKAKKDKL